MKIKHRILSVIGLVILILLLNIWFYKMLTFLFNLFLSAVVFTIITIVVDFIGYIITGPVDTFIWYPNNLTDKYDQPYFFVLVFFCLIAALLTGLSIITATNLLPLWEFLDVLLK